MTGLVESVDPFGASTLARKNLYHLVSQETDGFVLGLVESPNGVWGWVDGSAGEDAILDLQYVFDPIGTVEKADSVPGLPNPVLEITPIRSAQAAWAQDFDTQSSFRSQVSGRDAVPQPLPDPMWNFLRCARTVPGGAILTLLAPASELEDSMADSAWSQAFHGGSNTEWQMWRGVRMIRARSFLCADTGRVPTRMRAARTQMSQRIGFDVVRAADQRELRVPNPDILKGFAVPFGVYGSLVTLPAAGVGERIPGLPTVKPPVPVVPLDVTDAPRGILRLGEASTPDGQLVPVHQSPFDKLRHTQIVGKPGGGKTTMLVNDCVQYHTHGVGFLYLDPHGEGGPRVLRDIPPGSRSRLWFVNHGDTDHIVPVNPLAAVDEQSFARAVALVCDMLRRYIDIRNTGMWGERASRIFTLIGTACWHTGDVSLPKIAAIVADQGMVRQLAKQVSPVKPALARQISSELGDLSSPDSRELFSWMGSRLGQLMNSPLLMKILGTGANAIDMVGIMDRGEGLVVDLGLGGGAMGADAVRVLEGCYLILVDLAKGIRQRRDKPFGCIVDEAHTVQIGPLASLLDEGRKFGVFVEAAHQRQDQLEPGFADALAADTSTFLCLGAGPDDARTASLRLSGWPVTELTRLPAFQAAAVICRDGVTSEPFTLFVDRPRSYHDADAASRDDNALRITEESILTLSTPYAALVPTTPDNIADALRRPPDPARTAELSGLQIQPVTREGQLSRLASDLKQLAQAKRVDETREELLRGELGAQRVDQPRLWDNRVPGRRPSGSALARFLESRGVQNPSRRVVTS